MQHQVPYSFSMTIDSGKGPEPRVYTVMVCSESTRSGKQVIRTRTHHEAAANKYEVSLTKGDLTSMAMCLYYWDNLRYAVVRSLCEEEFDDYCDWKDIEEFLATLPKPIPRTVPGPYNAYSEQDPKYFERFITAFPEFKIELLDNGYI